MEEEEFEDFSSEIKKANTQKSFGIYEIQSFKFEKIFRKYVDPTMAYLSNHELEGVMVELRGTRPGMIDYKKLLCGSTRTVSGPWQKGLAAKGEPRASPGPLGGGGQPQRRRSSALLPGSPGGTGAGIFPEARAGARARQLSTPISTAETGKIITAGLSATSNFGIAELLRSNMGLTILNLRGNQLGDEFGVPLAKALVQNTSLKELDLSSNMINEDGGIAIAEWLEENNILTALNLSLNCLGGGGPIPNDVISDAPNIFVEPKLAAVVDDVSKVANYTNSEDMVWKGEACLVSAPGTPRGAAGDEEGEEEDGEGGGGGGEPRESGGDPLLSGRALAAGSTTSLLLDRHRRKSTWAQGGGSSPPLGSFAASLRGGSSGGGGERAASPSSSSLGGSPQAARPKSRARRGRGMGGGGGALGPDDEQRPQFEYRVGQRAGRRLARALARNRTLTVLNLQYNGMGFKAITALLQAKQTQGTALKQLML